MTAQDSFHTRQVKTIIGPEPEVGGAATQRTLSCLLALGARIGTWVAVTCLLFAPAAIAIDSTCYGTTRTGRLDNGVMLPGEGANFISYGTIPEMAGRTYVHSKVRDAVVEAYRLLETEQPGKVFKYAETGLEGGGEFKPHKTHRNGLSVDFMVPVLDLKGNSVHLPTHPLNRYGYDIEFDRIGNYKGYRIDFEAMAAHIVALDTAAHGYGVRIWRVLFDPELQPYLYRTRYGKRIKENIQIPAKRSWVRHDEHYHVDFVVPCKPMSEGGDN